MKVGISTASLFNRMVNEDAAIFLKKNQIDVAEIFLTSFSEYTDSFASLVKTNLGKVNVNSIHVLNTEFEPQLFNINERVCSDAFFWLEKCMSAAKILGAKYYSFHGLARLKKSSRLEAWNNYYDWANSLCKINDICERYNVRLSLENVEWSMYDKPGVFKKILEYNPSLLGVLDIKQARISSYPYEQYIEDMAGHISHVHISDVDFNGKICLPGKGIFDFISLLKKLRDTGFNGVLLIEVYSSNYMQLKDLVDSYNFIKEILYKYSL